MAKHCSREEYAVLGICHGEDETCSCECKICYSPEWIIDIDELNKLLQTQEDEN